MLVEAGHNWPQAEEFARRTQNQRMLECIAEVEHFAEQGIIRLPNPRAQQPLVSEQRQVGAVNAEQRRVDGHSFEALIRHLSAHPELFETVDPNMKLSLLLVAAAHGLLAQVQNLLARGASVTFTDHNGNTPLHVAIINKHKDVAIHLIHSGSNINLPNKLGQTPLMLAAGLCDGHIPHE